MLSDSKKISIRQASLLFLTAIFSPAIRIVPVFAAKHAKEAAWLSPLAAMIFLLVISFVWQRLYKNYGSFSMMYIYSNISGKFFGNIISFLYLFWITLLTALYVRYFAIRLLSSIFPNTNMSVFIITMLMLVIYIMRYGLVTLARLNEVFFPILVITFILLFIMLLPYIKLDFLTPITYRSILPVFNASFGIVGVFVYFSFLFIIGDYINNKEKIFNTGLQICVFLLINLTILIISTVGTFSYSVIARTELPFLIAVKQISLFNTLEKIESVVVSLWVTTDFVLISFFVLLAMRLIKSIFKLSDEKPLLSIYIIFIYFLSLYIANSVFEMEALSNNFILYGNVVMGFIIPVIMLLVGKLRNKV